MNSLIRPGSALSATSTNASGSGGSRPIAREIRSPSLTLAHLPCRAPAGRFRRGHSGRATLTRRAWLRYLPAPTAPRRTGRPPGQPARLPGHGLVWGQDRPKAGIVVPVVRVVVVPVRRPAVVVVVVPTATANHAVEARWRPPQIVPRRAAGSPSFPPAAEKVSVACHPGGQPGVHASVRRERVTAGKIRRRARPRRFCGGSVYGRNTVAHSITASVKRQACHMFPVPCANGGATVR